MRFKQALLKSMLLLLLTMLMVELMITSAADCSFSRFLQHKHTYLFYTTCEYLDVFLNRKHKNTRYISSL